MGTLNEISPRLIRSSQLKPRSVPCRTPIEKEEYPDKALVDINISSKPDDPHPYEALPECLGENLCSADNFRGKLSAPKFSFAVHFGTLGSFGTVVNVKIP
mmetsp:Transcript_16485/g.47412  ORF Transcript_16485/g.47412 Transcript_16485/m.47412 type:complete len:101 (+) Transcript_16485:731-1033(+)